MSRSGAMTVTSAMSTSMSALVWLLLPSRMTSAMWSAMSSSVAGPGERGASSIS